MRREQPRVVGTNHRLLLGAAFAITVAVLLLLAGGFRQAQAASVVTYQDNQRNNVYHAGWVGYQESDGTNYYAENAGSYASLSFTGTSIKWVTGKGPDDGIAKVYLDGKLVKTYDGYSPAFSAGGVVGYTKKGLPKKKHTIKIVNTGQKNASSGYTYTSVDGFRVGNKLVADNALQVTYGVKVPDFNGSWIGRTSAKALGGTYRQSTGSGICSGVVAVSGPEVGLVTATGPNMGLAKVAVRDSMTGELVKEVTFKLYSKSAKWKVVKRITGLDPGKIYSTCAYSFPGSGPIVVDAWKGTPPPAPSAKVGLPAPNPDERLGVPERTR